GLYRAPLVIKNSDETKKLWSGTIWMCYSRTWQESAKIGMITHKFQVWRFLLNGDLVNTADAGDSPCPVPPCAKDFKAVHFWGYIDYAYDFVTAAYSTAWTLNHECDMIHHIEGQPRGTKSGTDPVSYHPDRSYAFVGPAVGFLVDPAVPDELAVGPGGFH